MNVTDDTEPVRQFLLACVSGGGGAVLVLGTEDVSFRINDFPWTQSMHLTVPREAVLSASMCAEQPCGTWPP